MTDVAATADDPRRALWLIGYIAPAVAPVLGLLTLAGLSASIIAYLPLVLLFGVAPVVDHLIGRDHRNPETGAIAALEADPYYRRILHGTVIAYAVAVICAVWLSAHAGFSTREWWAFAIGAGFVHSLIVLVAHELGHSHDRSDNRTAWAALALMSYGHFGVEHNLTHHVKVATPDDPASSRFGESIYAFALREMPGVFRGAIRVEGDRLRRRGLGWWNASNELLRSWATSLAFAALLGAAFGWGAVLFYAVHCLTLWFSITMANYTAHYGLLRRMVNGRREPCRAAHSWSSSFLFSNLLFLNLQRHADHHLNAQRPFQTLSHIEGSPQLPAGIPGLFCIMLIPPLWFRVMNRRLLDYVDGDESRINFGPVSDPGADR